MTRITVLIVDDEQFIERYFCRCLSAEEYDLLVARTLDEARKIIEERGYEIDIMATEAWIGVRWGKPNTLDLIGYAKEKLRKGIPIIAMSSSPELIPELMAAGCSMYVATKIELPEVIRDRFRNEGQIIS